MAAFTAERVGGSADFVVAGLGLPSEGGEELDRRLLYESVFRINAVHLNPIPPQN